jgi:hypothetical protein
VPGTRSRPRVLTWTSMRPRSCWLMRPLSNRWSWHRAGSGDGRTLWSVVTQDGDGAPVSLGSPRLFPAVQGHLLGHVSAEVRTRARVAHRA